MFSLESLFDLSRCGFKAIFNNIELPWEAVSGIAQYIDTHMTRGIHGQVSSGAIIAGDVHIGKGSMVESGATIIGPAIIGEDCNIFASTCIRKNVIIGNKVLIGRNTEIKNSILFDEATVPHFNYVGDSILGWKSHMGAGAKTANVRLDGQAVKVKFGDERYETGLMKLGAIIGDEVEIGCNTVLNPGTIIGKRTIVYAGASISGTFPPDSIVKVHQHCEIVQKKNE